MMNSYLAAATASALMIVSSVSAEDVANSIAAVNSTTFVPQDFEASRLIKAFRNVPRLSKDMQFVDMFSSSAKNEYILSTSLIAVILISAVAFWLFLLLAFKILGPNRLCECAADTGIAGNDVQKPDLVALHSMHPLAAARRYEEDRGDIESAVDTRVTDTTSQIMNAQEQALWVEKVEEIEKRVRNIRIASLFFGLLLIASSVLMILFGMNELKNVSDQIQDFSSTMGGIFKTASDLIESFVEKGVVAVRSRDELIEKLDGLCPSCDASGEVLVNDGDFKTVAAAFITNAFKTPLAALSDLNLPKILNLQEALAAISAGFYKIGQDFDSKDWVYPTALVVISLMDAIALVYVVGIVLAWKDRSTPRFQFIQSYILLPFFILFVVAAVVFCSMVSVATVMDADFCTGSADTIQSPSDSVAAIIDTRAYPTDPAYTAVAHIIQGCQGVDPLEPMHSLVTEFDSVLSAHDTFQDQIKGHDSAALSDALGIPIDQLITVLGNAGNFESTLSSLEADTDSIASVLECSAMNRAYTDVTYDGICNTGARALTWMFACLGLVAISGMSLITLRASWRDIIDFVDLAEPQNKMATIEEYGETSEGSPHDMGEEMIYGEEPIYDDGMDIDDMVFTYPSENRGDSYYR